tara:strand:- start:5392 stop:5820 length:429 start_codon:yes stop_codon:yes gene_type:complete
MINNRDVHGYKEIEAMVHEFQKNIEKGFDKVIYGYTQSHVDMNSKQIPFTTYSMGYRRECLSNLHTIAVIKQTLLELFCDIREMRGKTLHIRRPLALHITSYVEPKEYTPLTWEKPEGECMKKIPPSSGIVEFTISARMAVE